MNFVVRFLQLIYAVIHVVRGKGKESMTFKEKYLNDEIAFEEIDEYVYEWGMSDTEMTLREYLGLSEDEERVWVEESEEEFQTLLDNQKK